MARSEKKNDICTFFFIVSGSSITDKNCQTEKSDEYKDNKLVG